ncbi:MAG: hypothetical protein VB089_03565 [Anaerolineaceae bacterium]|nr:hypothetical protein [Anaerolineaceae bacterium]
MQSREKVVGTALRLVASLGLAGFAWGVYQDILVRYTPSFNAGVRFPRSMVAIVLFGGLVGLASLAYVWFPAIFRPLQSLRARLGWLRWAAILAVALVTSYFFLYTSWSEVFGGAYLRLLVLLSMTALMAWLAVGEAEQAFQWNGLLAAGVLFGSVFSFLAALQGVLAYPFSLSWSEGNRLWDYSVLFGRHLYDYAGGDIPAYIDRGRQALWGMPFLLPSVSIQAVRLWSALVFTVPYALLGLFMFRSAGEQNKIGEWLLLGLWSFLVINQGPIYTPLVLAAILVAATRRMPLLPAALVVMLASYYARYSRFTWFVAPGMWAAMLAFIETNPYGVRSTLGRWVRTIVLGLSGLVGGYFLYELVTWLQSRAAGVAAAPAGLEAVGGMVDRQPLLWERLWPNETYAAGIVLGLVMAVGPLVVLLAIFHLRRWRLNIWQSLAMWGALAAFLGVGIIVSVKIGGGSNLHNVDMFLIGLLFATALAWEAGLRDWVLDARQRPWWALALALLAVFFPATLGMMSARPTGYPTQGRAAEVLEAVQQAVADYSAQGEVLFMDQRQLLTFEAVPQVPLVADYEKKWMMDEAMAEDAAYFQPFYRDLKAHRFTLIISEPLWIRFQGDTYHFGNENDAWVKWVSIPVLCYYEPVETYLDVGVQLLTPRDGLLDDPTVTCP